MGGTFFWGRGFIIAHTNLKTKFKISLVVNLGGKTNSSGEIGERVLEDILQGGGTQFQEESGIGCHTVCNLGNISVPAYSKSNLSTHTNGRPFWTASFFIHLAIKKNNNKTSHPKTTCLGEKVTEVLQSAGSLSRQQPFFHVILVDFWGAACAQAEVMSVCGNCMWQFKGFRPK